MVENHKGISVKKFELCGCAVSTHVSYSGGLCFKYQLRDALYGLGLMCKMTKVTLM